MIKGKQGYALRAIDLYFVARGDWKVLTSKEFGDAYLKQRKQQADKQEGGAMTAGFLTDKELAKRGLKTVTGKHWGDRYFYSTITLCDMVEVSATRYAVLNETDGGVVVAGRLDPRFAKDPDYPNQWRPVTKDALGIPVLGKKNPYSGTGFYLKLTRLMRPETIFFEFHAAFNEPQGWFDGEPTLSPKLGNMVNYKFVDFRGKLAHASQDAKTKAEGGGGKAEGGGGRRKAEGGGGRRRGKERVGRVQRAPPKSARFPSPPAPLPEGEGSSSRRRDQRRAAIAS